MILFEEKNSYGSAGTTTTKETEKNLHVPWLLLQSRGKFYNQQVDLEL